MVILNKYLLQYITVHNVQAFTHLKSHLCPIYFVYDQNVTGWDRSHGLPAQSRVWQHVKLSDVSLGTRPRYSPVADQDFKKQSKQTNKFTTRHYYITYINIVLV